MPESLTFEEAIGLTSEPLAVFDSSANLRLANGAFAEALRPLDGYLETGTPWAVILTEAVRKGLIAETDVAALRVSEERYLDRPEAQPEATFTLSDGTTASAALRRTSDDGFALALTRESSAAETATESELEVIMSKVLEACPTCLTMSRIGDGRILYRSPAAAALLGKGLNSLEHFADRAERADFLTALLPTAAVDDMRITALGAGGREFPAAISARLIDYRGEDVIVASIDDLTEHLAADREIERQKKQLFQLEKMSALGQVLSGIAHELNNPLSVVVGNAHLLLEEDIDANLRRRVEKMTSAAERCVRIVRTFLSMARDRPLVLERRRAEDIIRAATDAFAANDLGAGVPVNVFVAEGLPTLLIDEVQVIQVLVNILSNAVQAMDATQANKRIGIEARQSDLGVEFRLTDNGPGVPENIRDRIFEPLFTTKGESEGTGIGLALCHRLVVAHGGTIELAPTKGHGAEFVIDLPAAPD